LTLRINAVFLLGAVLMFAVKAIQDGGILRSANTTKILGISAMIPLILIGVVPILTGDTSSGEFFPAGAAGARRRRYVSSTAPGIWRAYRGRRRHVPRRLVHLRLRDGGVLHLRTQESEDRHLQGDFLFRPALRRGVHPGALRLSGLPGPGRPGDAGGGRRHGAVTTPAVYSGMLAPDIYSGMGVAAVMAKMVHAGRLLGAVVVIMLVLALVLSLITSMAGSSRTLYQASVDGWLPKYLSKVNEHHAPSNAMLTDLCFNLLLLLMSDSVFVIGAANVGYMIFNFLNLNAGWIHRMDRPLQERPWRAPNWVLAVGAALSFVNLAFMGFGADVYGVGT
jgi:amino acid transporter